MLVPSMYTFTGESKLQYIAASSCSAKQLSSTCSKAYSFHVARIIGGVYSGLKSFNSTLASRRGVGVLSGTYGIRCSRFTGARSLLDNARPRRTIWRSGVSASNLGCSNGRFLDLLLPLTVLGHTRGRLE